MSRIGKNPVPLPDKVKASVRDRTVHVEGPLGKLDWTFAFGLTVTVDEAARLIRVERPDDQRRHRALHGLTRALIANMVEGVTKGFEKRLEVFGLGYRVELDDRTLVLQIGYSQPCRIPIPDDLDVHVEQNRIAVRGADKERVGQFAANIKKLRKMSVYRPRGSDLRGIRYAGEKIRFKAGKAGKVGG